MRDDLEDADPLEEEFPLGEGTADTDAVVICPYCGEENEIAIDPGSGPAQEYVEDCPVCCRPWRVIIAYDHQGTASTHIEPADDI